MVFPVVMYGCEGWTMKKAEWWKIDAFELWYWRRLLRVPWTARGSNQSILKEVSPECSLEGLMLKLKLQYFGRVMWRVDSLEKTLMLGGIGVRRRRGWQKMRWLDGITDSMDVESEWTPGVGDGQRGLVCCDSWGRRESDMTERLNWTELNTEDSEDMGLIHELERSPGRGNDNPLQYSCLGNPMDRGAWRATVHWVTESDTAYRTCIKPSDVTLWRGWFDNLGLVGQDLSILWLVRLFNK